MLQYPIRSPPFTLMRIRFRIQLPKMMRILPDPDPQHCLLYCIVCGLFLFVETFLFVGKEWWGGL